jgi:predicted flap endonuclease-1-like 5' DNA nuclease
MEVFMNIEKVEGIGPKYASILRDVGIRTTGALLNAGASKRGREVLAGKSGISETLILEWVNLVDLMRIKGVGEEYSDLLEEAGVDSVKELRNRIPENLHQKMLETNQMKRLVRRPPSLKQIKSWVAQAKSLAPVVTH